MSSTNIGGSIIGGFQATTSSGGLGSGIDVSTLVAAAMATQTAELAVMQGQQTALTNEQTALSSFNTDVQAVQTAVFALTDPAGQLTDVTATSSDTAILNASATAGTPSGEHTVTVANLATTSSAYSNEVASGSTPIATGTLTIQVGAKTGTPITIDNTNNTLAGLAQAINNSSAGVTASVISDANGSRLALVSNTNGAPGNLTITPSAGGLGFNTGVTGVNANLTVDGIPIASTTNTVTSAIPGVTLTLTGPTTGAAAVTVTTGPDVSNQTDAINSFVSAYNTAIGDLNTQFSVNSSTQQQGPLASDSTLALAQSQLLSSVSFAQSGTGTINSLASLGITMNDDGTLTVNSGALTSALQSNPSGVQNFFQATSKGSFGSNLSSNLDSIANPITGALQQDATGLAQTQTSLTQQISDFQDQLNTTQAQLTQEYVQVDTTLQQLPLLLQQVNQQLASLG